MTFDWWTLAIQAVNFLVLVWLLQRFLYKPVADIIEKRREQVDEVLREAEQTKAEAEAARQDYERRVADLDKERQKVLDEAHRQITADRQAALDDARDEADTMLAEAKESIDKERAKALKAMRGQIADLAGDMAAKLLGEAAPRVPNDYFLNAVCEKVGTLPKKEQNRLRRALAADGAAVTVVTAQPLNRTDKAKWRNQLKAALGDNAKTTFKSDAGLIGGAEVRFPDAVMRLSWNSELEKIKGSFVQDGNAS
jgi:F-type H+-transporting ATPase subunit b